MFSPPDPDREGGRDMAGLPPSQAGVGGGRGRRRKPPRLPPRRQGLGHEVSPTYCPGDSVAYTAVLRNNVLFPFLSYIICLVRLGQLYLIN